MKLSTLLFSITSGQKGLPRNFVNSICQRLTNQSFRQSLLNNAELRGEKIDLGRIQALLSATTLDSDKESELIKHLSNIPNWTHPNVPFGDQSAFKVLRLHKAEVGKNTEPVPAEKFAITNNWMRIADTTGLVFGPKTYTFIGPLCRLEESLIQYAVNKITSKGFNLIHVPEIINSRIINGCGFATDSYRSQVYKLSPSQHFSEEALCLAGTSEISLSGFVSERCFDEKDFPLKLCALSRCFRAEASDNVKDKGLYRVHQFYKVEMYMVQKNDVELSNCLHEELLSIEEEMCRDLELSYRVLDIPSKDLGAPAYRKFDIEAWLPGHNLYGEVTSASNCTDWQASRLGITYRTSHGDKLFAHTLNGTAMAIPRIIMALLETHQDGTEVKLPKALHRFYGEAKMVPLGRLWKFSPSQNLSGLLDAP